MGFTVELSRSECRILTLITQILPVPMRPGETPVPIPNTTVKTWAADGTTLETAWESRRVPDQKKNNQAEPVY